MDQNDGAIWDENTNKETKFELWHYDNDLYYETMEGYEIDRRLKDRQYRCPLTNGNYQNTDYKTS